MSDPGILIPIIAISIPIVAIWTKHLQRMEELRSQRGATLSPDIREEINALRNEVIALRETSTRFDMSFDAALTSLESRVERIETQPWAETTSRDSISPVRVREAQPQTVTLGVGKGS